MRSRVLEQGLLPERLVVGMDNDGAPPPPELMWPLDALWLQPRRQAFAGPPPPPMALAASAAYYFVDDYGGVQGPFTPENMRDWRGTRDSNAIFMSMCPCPCAHAHDHVYSLELLARDVGSERHLPHAIPTRVGDLLSMVLISFPW